VQQAGRIQVNGTYEAAALLAADRDARCLPAGFWTVSVLAEAVLAEAVSTTLASAPSTAAGCVVAAALAAAARTFVDTVADLAAAGFPGSLGLRHPTGL
jgi:hypothetical protein